MQFALLLVFQHPFAVQHQSQLAGCQTVEIRYLELADKGDAVVFREVAFYFYSAQRIGAVQYHKFFSVFRGGFHSQSHRTDISKGAAAYILNVDRKSTRLNSSHANISYAVFCLKKKKRQSQGSRCRTVRDWMCSAW